MVSLNHNNIIHSANNIVISLDLNNSDKTINIMPLFHIHGIMASLIAPLSIGSAIVAAPQFNALLFLNG